ncbi:OB-fold protein [Leptospira fletcheri]|nr:hypothetical protein [Leptospira fletcheri]
MFEVIRTNQPDDPSKALDPENIDDRQAEFDANKDLYIKQFCNMKILGERNEGQILGVIVREYPTNPYFKSIWKFKKIANKLYLIEVDETTLGYPQYEYRDLKSEFESNALKASSELQGKIIGVNGTVWKVDKDLLGKPYIAFSGLEETGNSFDFGFLKCFLLPETLGLARMVEKGQRINVTGKLVGQEFIKIELKECAISESTVRGEGNEDSNWQ